MKEAARVALVRMKYSQSLRKAEFARARRATGWDKFQTGDIVYFYREQKPVTTRGTKRKEVLLRQWHGPSIVVAIEGGQIAYSSLCHLQGQSDQVCYAAPAACDDRGEVSERRMEGLAGRGDRRVRDS